jgi:hypothetical protein
MSNRKGEAGSIPFRSGRLFSVGAVWYFSTRDGHEGPFEDRNDAEAALTLFIREKITENERIMHDGD